MSIIVKHTDSVVVFLYIVSSKALFVVLGSFKFVTNQFGGSHYYTKRAIEVALLVSEKSNDCKREKESH